MRRNVPARPPFSLALADRRRIGCDVYMHPRGANQYASFCHLLCSPLILVFFFSFSRFLLININRECGIVCSWLLTRSLPPVSASSSDEATDSDTCSTSNEDFRLGRSSARTLKKYTCIQMHVCIQEHGVFSTAMYEYVHVPVCMYT